MTPAAVVVASRDPALLERATAAAGQLPVRSVASLPAAASAAVGELWLVDTALPDLPAWRDEFWKAFASRALFVILSSTPQDEEGLEALDAGASGYCHAYVPAETLEQVIAVTSKGNLWVGRTLMARLLRGMNRTLGARGEAEGWSAPLTPREREVASRASIGESNQEIATALGITERTVKAHLTVVFEKLGVDDRLQLTLRIHGIR